ncbi:hypothetical protein CCO03_16260 [Comamonas serinivorans]|uniref:Histidine phosphatase family protein n=1 Tax=Comamonas serinivorans TaxID=1082851 RepID=A0A1Y0EQY4_9BURK|nr:histidine phosphatase family protein [Comamonas serinivorans]ARU06013.1 hypothetical protein CCO03_16260 [Comamonas serinivorans]
MGSIYLIRHGQASFGSANYDELSPRGWQQSRVLGQHLQALGVQFDAVMTGTLQRQIHTWDGICEGAGWGHHEPLRHPGLNEYDSGAVLRAHLPEPLGKPDTPELRRLHFQKLREGLKAWIAGTLKPDGMPSYADWVAAQQDALQKAHALAPNGRVAIVSSGGPITTLIGGLTGMPPESSIELNLRIKNTAIAELVTTSRRMSLLSFNETPHLQTPATQDLLTYA